MSKRRTAVAVISVLVVFTVAVVAGSAGKSRQAPTRPKILGISGIEILSTHVDAAKLFYGKFVELDGPCNWCENNPYRAVMMPSGQILGITPAQGAPKDLIASICFAVDNEKEMKRWLQANHVAFKETYGPFHDGEAHLLVVDPEGHTLYFHKLIKGDETMYGHVPVIHAGFVVKDPAAMDKLYKDVLGFRVYWHGGMRDGETDWVDMQVPDGTDWVEYMLNVSENADKRTLGVMNHIAIGVPDVRAAAQQLEARGVKLSEQPKIGRDGKWQLNLYDPDDTRVELMQFTPSEKPCCAEYSGPHPKP